MLRTMAANLLAVLLIPCAAAVELFDALPEDLAGAEWDKTPLQVLMNPQEGEPLIWIGAVESFAFAENEEGGIQLEWTCRHLTFAITGPAAIRSRPIPVLDSNEGLFMIRLETDMSYGHAQRLSEEFASKQHYVLVAGVYESTSLAGDEMAVRVAVEKMELSDELVEIVE